jgi:hypothetical protein
MANLARRPDYNTPTQLAMLGVAANQGTVMLERGWWSWKDPESKKFLLRLQYVMPAAKAIPRPGDAVKRTDGASQLLMGNMLGEDRSTMNRDVQLFSGEEAQIAFLLNKWRPAIGCVNRYSRRTAEQEPELTQENALKSNDPAELARRYGEDLFDATMNGASGAGRVALWTFDENMPRPLRCVCRKGQMKFNFSSNCMKCGGKGFTLDPERKMGANPRVLLATLQLKGIVSFGKLDITCAALGELAGMCENTVAECHFSPLFIGAHVSTEQHAGVGSHLALISVPSSSGHTFQLSATSGHQRSRIRISVPSSSGHTFQLARETRTALCRNDFSPLFIGAHVSTEKSAA